MASGGRTFQLLDILLLCVSVRTEHSIECRDSFSKVLTNLLALSTCTCTVLDHRRY
jgi:hypothetical protein